MQDNERSANGVRGVLIRTLDPDNPLVFRIYGESDERGRKPFKDYIIAHHDLTVVIDDNYSSFFEKNVDGYAGVVSYPSRLTVPFKKEKKNETATGDDNRSG